MTKKHYIAVAAVIRGELDKALTDETILAVERIAYKMATLFADDNPQFVASRFMAACGL